MAELQILPMTDGTLSVLVTDPTTGATLSDATLIATVRNPKGGVVATNSPMTSAGSGVYTLAVSRTWSTLNTKPVQGEFTARITATRAGLQLVADVRYNVRFTDDT